MYETEDGDCPYTVWFEALRDKRAKQRIGARIRRVEGGNFGDSKAVGEGVIELRVDYGPGYRVYFGRDGNKLVVLLIGGDKRTQAKDIAAAKGYWADYKARRTEEQNDTHS
ncbi:MAG: type II toxin-antitoxin system RelE/ParE family toxin [Pirellulales bacterium]